jgi:sugar fermentation stimulation protein A
MFAVPGIDPPAAAGRLLERRNRFVVEVSVAGRATTASLPNPGKLGELFVHNAELGLAPGPEGGKHPYRVVSVRSGSETIFLDTGKTNAVAAELLKRKLVPSLAQYELERMEVALPERAGAAPSGRGVPKSRIDMRLTGPAGPLYVEVKSCTLFNGRFAMFPDAVTERGRRHLLELAERRNTGVLFVVHSDRPDRFFPDIHNDLAFARAFREAARTLPIIPVGVRWSPALRIERVRDEIEIPWELLDTHLEDRGSYLVLLRLPRREELTVGRLGLRRFEAGFYLYVGSAQQGLSKRIERHRRRSRKRMHWHIDYLRERAEWISAYPVRGREHREAEIGRQFRSLADGAVEGFGSSDSPLPSHLFYFAEEPRRRKDFQEQLLQARNPEYSR